MKTERKVGAMFISTIIMGMLAFALLFAGYQRGDGEHVVGLKSAVSTTIEVFP